MSKAKGQNKNVVQDTDIEAGGDVIIGDRTINNYFAQNPGNFGFLKTVVVVMLMLSFIVVVVFMVYPQMAEKFPDDYMRSIVVGAFSFIILSVLLFLLHLQSKSNV